MRHGEEAYWNEVRDKLQRAEADIARLREALTLVLNSDDTEGAWLAAHEALAATEPKR